MAGRHLVNSGSLCLLQHSLIDLECFLVLVPHCFSLCINGQFMEHLGRGLAIYKILSHYRLSGLSLVIAFANGGKKHLLSSVMHWVVS